MCSSDLWGKIFTAIGVVAVTGSVPLAFVIAAIQIVFELKTADLFKDEIYELTGIPGVTCTHKMVFLSAIFYPIDKLLRKIPALDKQADAAALKEKVGIFAENHVLGFIIGCLFGVMGGYDFAAILTLGIQAAMCLTLFPVISKYFMESLSRFPRPYPTTCTRSLPTSSWLLVLIGRSWVARTRFGLP